MGTPLHSRSPGRPPARAVASPCTCLRLRKVARRVSQIYDHCLEPHQLTITQYGLLGHIKALDGVGIGELANALVMDPTTLTRNIRPLVKRALVVLVPDLRDRRHRKLYLTDAGRELFAKARGGWDAAQRQIALALGAKDGPMLAATIDRLLEKLAT